MKRFFVVILLLVSTLTCAAQGVPYIRNFSEKDYDAHSRNFDITVDSVGVVWVANFEGLLYFDNAKWRTLHIPGFARTTVVYDDKDGAIWVGGYNFFGKVKIDENGSPYIFQLSGVENYQGEVQEIWEKDGKLKFLVSNGNVCFVENENVVIERRIGSEIITGVNDVIDVDQVEKANKVNILDDVIVDEKIDNGFSVILPKNNGIEIVDSLHNKLYSISEENGLISNNVSYVVYEKGVLWGVGEKSIFAIRVPSPYSFFGVQNGISGSVLSIRKYNGKIYAASLNGLFVLENSKFLKVKCFLHACWSLIEVGGELYCATPEGVFSLSGRRLSNTSALSLVKIDDNSFLAGCVDGVYLFKIKENISARICPLEKVITMKQDDEGTIWLQNLYGQIWKKRKDSMECSPFGNLENQQSQHAVVIVDGKAEIVGSNDKTPFEYPLFSHYDFDGISWITDYSGRNISRWKNGKRLDDRLIELYSIKDLIVRSFYKENGKIWLGSDNGIVVVDLRAKDPAYDSKPIIKIRNVVVGGDSIVWGGFGTMPKSLGEFEPEMRRFKFEYSLNGYIPSESRPLYRYRLNGASWSNYSDDIDAEFLNLHYGSYVFEVQGKSIYGIESEPIEISFSIKYPFYMRWYAGVFYVFVFVVLLFAYLRYRVRRLKLEKIKLEKIVDERTAEVVRQKDEIQLKSESLEEALAELSSTQNELIRQEKMATVGKLTQGLIDRILNPLNYINNFSKLSIGLLGDLSANIEDDKDKMDEENYEDTIDVIEMMKGNLEKVAAHGLNTTRTLKAMEELLKDRSGGIVQTELRALLKQNEEVVSKYHEECIGKFGIKVTFNLPETPMPMDGNPDLLSKTFMSIINNGFYAVVKKAEKQKYSPEIKVSATLEKDGYLIKFYDNGIGIEDTILDKVFDPFFTTKPTGEASGVGLYLSREIIQNHHGDITVRSEKDKFTEFTVKIIV